MFIWAGAIWHPVATYEKVHRAAMGPLRPNAFGDFLFFHPHLHLLAADGLFDSQGRFHCMPAEGYAAAIELFLHRFLHALREAKHISPRKLADLLSWQHSGRRDRRLEDRRQKTEDKI